MDRVVKSKRTEGYQLMIFVPAGDVDFVPCKSNTESSNCRVSINEHLLRAAYEYLCTCKPFSRWHMPRAVRFKVSTSTMTLGMYQPDPPTITISKQSNANYGDVLCTLAHECVHLHLERSHGGHEEHDEKFNACAKQVCDQFGWDVKGF